MKKILTVFVILLLILFTVPNKALAVYYNRSGNPILLDSSTQIKKSVPKSEPEIIGLSIKNRWNMTHQYDFIIKNKCKVDAVNLYLGETLYSCPSGARFWSRISIHPTDLELSSKNKSKVDDEKMDDAIDSAIISSVVIN